MSSQDLLWQHSGSATLMEQFLLGLQIDIKGKSVLPFSGMVTVPVNRDPFSQLVPLTAAIQTF